MTQLRVGIVCPYSLDIPGGVQNHVIGLAGQLTRDGHHADILAPGRPSAQALRRHGVPPGRFTSAGSAIPVRYNGSVARISFGAGPAIRVRRWLAAGAYDLLHLHEPVTPSIALHALAFAHQPVVATFHTANPHSQAMVVAGRLLSPLIDRIDARIAVSSTAARMVQQHLGRDCQIIPNGFSYAEFATADFASRPANGAPPRLVFLGRLAERRKGLDVLRAAMPLLRRQYPQLDVVAAGYGPRTLARDGVRLLGQVGDAERARLLTGADVFVAPHRSRESFGLVLIEAMAAGAPVVASDLPAFAEVLGSSGCCTGRLFRAGEPTALAEQVLATLAMSPTARQAQRRAARARTRQYDWSVVGPSIEAVYAQTLGSRGTNPADRAVPATAGSAR